MLNKIYSFKLTPWILLIILASSFYIPKAQAKVTENEKQLITQAIAVTQQAAADINNRQYNTAIQKLDVASGYLSAVMSKVTDNKLLVDIQRINPQLAVAKQYIQNQQYDPALTLTLQSGQDLDKSLKEAIARGGGNNNSNSNSGNSNSGNSNTTLNGNASATGPPNSAIDTGIGATFNVNLDENLGTFFNPLTAESVPELIAILVRILFVLTGIVAVIVIIIAGFRMVVDSGNETQMKKAKEAITWAVIGLIVSILAFSIVAIIQRIIQS